MWPRGRGRPGTGRRIAAGMIAGVAAIALAGPGVGAQDPVTIVIGVDEPWTTINPIVADTVSEREVWNIQYSGLTGLAAADYAPTPGLAASWVEHEPGVRYTYALREGLRWSDGEPLTADDVAWTVNTARDQQWDDYFDAVSGLHAEAVGDRTVTITSDVPDPRLPALTVGVMPRHIWEIAATDYATAVGHQALDGVGSGPFVLDEAGPESLVFVANDHHWGGRPSIDRLVLRHFPDPAAMVTALQQGEIDAAHGLPIHAMEGLAADPDIETVAGIHGGFDEIAFNGGQATGQPHPALLDLEFRRALNFAIDKAGAAERLWHGLARPATTISVGADLKWVPPIPAGQRFTYDPTRANEMLDTAGYLDSDGDGFREMPGGVENIVLRHAVNADNDLAGGVAELWQGWMTSIGVAVQLDVYDENRLLDVIAAGDYDTFYWGFVPFVDPSPMLSYFTSDELGRSNDANWSDPTFDELYAEQRRTVDPAARLALVHRMVRILHDAAVYPALWYVPDLQAYRTDRFVGFVRQPAGIGPVLFSASSPSYATLRPVGPTAPTATTAPGTGPTVAGDPTPHGTTAGHPTIPSTPAVAGGPPAAPGATTPVQLTPSPADEPDGGITLGAFVAVLATLTVVLALSAWAITRTAQLDRRARR